MSRLERDFERRGRPCAGPFLCAQREPPRTPPDDAITRGRDNERMSQPASPATTPGQLTPSHDRPTLTLIAGLMAASAAMLVIASIVHFGATIGGLHDPFRDAAVPEAVIASVLACGVAAVVLRPTNAWGIAVGATVFAVAGFSSVCAVPSSARVAPGWATSPITPAAWPSCSRRWRFSCRRLDGVPARS